MTIKLTTVNRAFVPDVSFPTEEGTMVQNRELPSSEQVFGEVTLASIGQKAEYLGTYTVGSKRDITGGEVKQFTVLQYERCVRKHVKNIKGLEAFEITSGRSLVDHETTPELNEVIQEFFFKVNGIHADDIEVGSDGGDLTSGESEASE